MPKKIVPDSSNPEPGEDGNTNILSLPTKKKQDAACRMWHVTLKHSSSSSNSVVSPQSLRDWIKEHCETAVWQLEKGETTGYEHWNISLKLKEKKRLTFFRHHFASDAHIEVPRNIDAVTDYCCKTETRIAGPYRWPEQVESVQDPLLGLPYYPWQQELIDIVDSPPNRRDVHWIHENIGNRGKTSFAIHLILTRNAIMLGGKKADIMHAMNNKYKIVVINASRTTENFISYDSIETLKDGACFSGKYESQMKLWNPPHVLVFANFAPDLTKMSADRWKIHEI